MWATLLSYWETYPSCQTQTKRNTLHPFIIYSLLSVKMSEDQKKNYACTHSKLQFHTNLIGQVGFFFPFIFYLLIINTPHLKTEMSWISIVGVSSNVIILESSNYKILSIFYYVYQTMWNTRQPKSAKFHF